MKVLLLSAAATAALTSATELNAEDISRHMLQHRQASARSIPDNESDNPRDLRAAPSREADGSSMQRSKSSKTNGKTDAAGYETSSKSGKVADNGNTGSKSSKTGGGNSKSGKSSKDAYYLGPISCPGRCVDVSGVDFMTGELSNVLKPCDNESREQTWRIHNDDTFVKVESMVYPGECIGIMNKAGCNGQSALVLGSCDDHESMWYFTGGQLVSAYCWVNGYTNAMNVIPNGNSCSPGLYGFEGSNDAVFRSDVFMFIDQEMIQDSDITPSPTASFTYIPTLSPSYYPTSSPI